MIEDGERIAQMVIARHEQAVWQGGGVLDEKEGGGLVTEGRRGAFLQMTRNLYKFTEILALRRLSCF